MNAMEWYSKFWQPTAHVVSDYTRHGVKLDVNECLSRGANVHSDVMDIIRELNAMAGCEINWSSPDQLAELLYGKMRLPIPPVKGTLKTIQANRGARTTAEAALAWLVINTKHKDFINTVMKYKKKARLLSFFNSLPTHVGPDGRIHASLGINTETGRLSCSNPNLQQQPPQTRPVFVAAPGHVLICLDYSALEWRILAHILVSRYGDTSLVDEVKQRIDPHSATAVKMGVARGSVDTLKKENPEARAIGKILNYAINYGKTARGLALQLGIPQKKAQGYLDKFYVARPGIRKFHNDIVDYARKSGHVRSLLGRRRYLKFGGKMDFRAKNQALNVVQNCAADVMALASLKAYPGQVAGWGSKELEELGAKQVLQVHDEIIWEVPEQHAERALKLCTYYMENALEGVREFHCPLKVEGGIGKSWGDIK